MIHDYARGIFTKGLMLVWLTLTSPPMLFLFWLGDNYPKLWPGFLLFVVPCIIAWGLGSWWLASRTAGHIFEGNHGFSISLKYTLGDLRMRFTFLPLIGHWFTPAKDPRNWQSEEEQPRSLSDHNKPQA
jgi:hypothetical protein